MKNKSKKEQNFIFINPNQTEAEQKQFKEMVSKIMMESIGQAVQKTA